MKKNDEQKVNKLKKEKVKKEKTKKIPKRDNASRKEKKINIKASPGGQKREKSEIPFYRSIAMRLVLLLKLQSRSGQLLRKDWKSAS